MKREGTQLRKFLEKIGCCLICLVVEDENHALFVCKAHELIRFRYRDLFQVYRVARKWGDIDFIANDFNLIEKKALKSCLAVKLSTADDIIFQELNIADIISRIRDRQFNFVK